MFQSPEYSLVAHKLPLLFCSGATFFGSLRSGLPPALLCPRLLRYPLLASPKLLPGLEPKRVMGLTIALSLTQDKCVDSASALRFTRHRVTRTGNTPGPT